MGSFDLAIELWRAALDVGVTDALIFDVPMEFGLELMAIIGPDFPDTERELGDDVIDEVDRIGLSVFVIDPERPDARCIVDGGILEAPDLLSLLAGEGEELDVHLDVMARDLLVVARGVDSTHARSAR